MNHERKAGIEEQEKEPVRIATKIGVISVVLNLLLGVTKIIIGRVVSSSAVFSDGVHGTGDVLTTVIAVISVWIAARKRNNKYNYGYERWASIASLILSVILFVTAGEIILESTESLISIIRGGSEESSLAFTSMWYLSLGLALASILIKAVMFFLTMYGAKKARSKAMRADAWHQVIDAFSSIAAVIALLGYIWLPERNYLDSLFTYPIAVMVICIGVETFKTACKELTDHAITEEKMNEVKKVLYMVVEEKAVKVIHSRIFSEKFYLDIYLLQDPKKTLEESDAIADKIKEKMFLAFPDCKNVYVIIEPDDDEHRSQEENLR